MSHHCGVGYHGPAPVSSWQENGTRAHASGGAWARVPRISRKSKFAFLHAHKALMADNQVVEHLNIKVLACLNQLLGRAHVFR